jgi:signal transduction histidine kinase/AmiR/NasT family two-component response regulator
VKQKLKPRPRKQSSRPAPLHPAASRRRAASSESEEIVPLTICVVAADLTQLAEANEALRSNEASLRVLSTRLLKVQDDERRRIARDLHDITGQKLAFQSIALSQILNRKSSGLDPESRRALLECSALSKQVGEEIRTLSYLLHPPLLDELGLSSAVKWYVEGFEQRSGIKVKVEMDSDFVRLAPDVEVTLFRVIQESLTNVHRYSASPNAFVLLKATANEIELQVGDSGKGMNQDTLDAKTGKVVPLGVGIQGMRERIRQLAGKLEITSQPNQGTLVKATLPLSTAQASASSESAVSPALLSPNHASAPSSVHRNSRKQILIADDHEMLRRGLRSMLEKELAWEICGEAVDGQDAVDKATELRPDLVILDINMPVLNGLAAVRQIRRNSPGTKILIFTVHDSDQTVKEIQAAGAHGILSKSNASEDLLRVVKELLASKQASSAAARSAAN